MTEIEIKTVDVTVEVASSNGDTNYTVAFAPTQYENDNQILNWSCTCPHWTHKLSKHGGYCKHIQAVRKLLTNEFTIEPKDSQQGTTVELSAQIETDFDNDTPVKGKKKGYLSFSPMRTGSASSDVEFDNKGEKKPNLRPKIPALGR